MVIGEVTMCKGKTLEATQNPMSKEEKYAVNSSGLKYD